MAILAIAIVMLYIGSVSAAENDDLNATVTAIDNSQNDNIVIYENNAQTDDTTQGGSSSVSFASENEDENLVGASEDDVLGADVSGYIQIRETNSESTGTFQSDAGEQIGIDVYWSSLSGMQFALLVNNQQVQTFYPSGWGGSWSDTLYYTPESAGTYNIMVICQGSSSRYISNTLVWEVSESIPKTETIISINPTTVAPGNDFTVSYNVYEKDTSNNVNEGTITFYDADGQIGSPIDLANPTTFSYSYNEKKVYNIYAVYSGTTNYKGSESEKSRLIVKDEGDPDPTVNLKIISVYSSYDNAYWACDDYYTFFGTYANTADKYDVVVTFEVESSSVPSSATITYGTTTMNSVTFSGINPTINFKSSMVGENIVKVTVDGIESNSVTVDVKSGSISTTQSISVSPTSATEGEIITLTPTVMSSSTWATGYSSVPISGMVSIYSNSSCLASDKIATVYTDGSSFTVPEIDATSGYEDVTFYVRFSGEYDGKYFYTPSSNSFTFRINAAELKDTTISLSPSSYTITQGESKEITPNVIAGSESVTVGTITYYDDGNPISGYTDVSVSTNFDTSALSIGTHTITAKYNGADGFNPSEISQPVTVTVNPVVGFSISVTNTTYPANPSATVTGEEGKTYTITITGTDKSFTVTIPAGQTKVTQDLGSIAAKSDYEAIVSYNGETNQTTFSISQGNPGLQVTVNGNNTLLTDTQTVTVTANGNGKVKINNGAEQDLGTITLSDLTAGMNTIEVSYTGDENYTSESKTVYVNVYEKYPTEITLVLNETGIAKGSSVKATPTVNNGDVTDGQVAFYYSNGDLIDTIDLSSASYLIFTPSGEEGESVSIYAKYLGTTTYAESANSEEKSVKIKKHLTISLTVDGKTSLYAQFATQGFDSNFNYVYSPSYIFYADCGGIAPVLKVYDNDEVVLGSYVGDSDTSIDLYWTSSEGSNHIVYVEFEGDDDYLPARSNDVTVKVLTTRSPSGIELNPSYGVEGTTVTITPAVYYSSYYSSEKEYLSGNLSLYSDYSRTNLIATVEIGETFTYTVPAVTSSYSPYSSTTLYGIFEGINGDYYYSSSSITASFYSMKENSATLTGNGETGPIEVIPDSNVLLHVEIENIYNQVQPEVKIYVDGEYKASFETTYDSSRGTYSLTDYSLSLSGLSNGEHNVYVVYEGYHDSSRHYDSAKSDNLTINIQIPAKDTTLTITNSTVTTVDLGNTITIEATLLDSDNNPVTTGNITYYIDGEAIVNLTAGTPFTTSSTLPVGPHTITAKYCGDEGYNPSEISNSISIEILQPMTDTLIITVENKDYPENVTATVTTSKTGTYTITIGSKTYHVEVTEVDNGVKTVTLDKFPVGDDYEVSIVCDDDSRLNNNTSFSVAVGSVDLAVTAIGNNTVYDEGAKSITVNVDAFNATGKIQFTGDITGEKAIGESLDLSDLASGTYTITVKYIDDVNYQAQDKTVTFNVLSELATAISIEISPETITKGGSIVITPAVVDANGNAVSQGQVEIYDGETLVATINLEDNSYTYTPSKGKGTFTDAIWAKYVQNETLKLGESVSEKKTYAVELEEVTPTITLELNTTEVLVNGKILITTKVVDSEGKDVTVGTVTLSKDSYYYNTITTINVGESYEFTVDTNSHNPYNNPYSVFARYNGADGENYTYLTTTTQSQNIYHVYSNSLTLTVNGEEEVTVYAGESVNLLADLYYGNGVITLHINDGDNGTITKGTSTPFTWGIGDYVITADYVRSSDYYASVSSNSVTVHVVEAPDLTVKIELDKTSVSKEETVTATVNVTANNVELREGTVEFYNESDVKIGEINLAETTSFAYTATGAAGTHSIWAKYVANTVYAEANSTKADYKIKGFLNIELTVNDESVESNVTISSSSYITIKGNTNGVNPGLVILVDGIESSTAIAENKDSNSIRFTSSDKGNHKIQLKFTGNDDYEESFSNIVDLNIFERVSVNPTVSVTPVNVMNGSKVIITVNADARGNISVYSDYDCTDLIQSIAISDGSFEYEVAVDSFSSSSKSVTLYAKYDGAKENFVDYVHGSRGSATFNVMRPNTMTLTNDTNEVKVGENVIITVDIADWHYAYEEGNYFSNVIINVDGVDKYEFGLKGSNELNNTYVLTFDDAREHVVYAYYKGYNASAGYSSCAPVTSEALTINVKPAVKDTVITISTDNTTVFTGENIKITPTVKSEGEDVLIGNVTYKYADGTEIASEVNVNTPFEFSIATPGEYDIIATYNGADDYYSNTTTDSIHITVKRIVGFTLEIATVKYPNVSKAKVTSDAAGTYTITINSKGYIVELTETELSKTIDLDSFAAGNDYEAIISHDGQTKTFNFNVSQGDVELDITVGNDTLVGESNNIKTNIDAVNVTGTVSYFEGETSLAENIAIGEAFDLKDLTSGLHTITVRYNGDNNYTATSKDVIVNVLAELPTEIIMDINETSISSAQAVKLNVTVTNRNGNVDNGIVEFYWKNNDSLIGSIDLHEADYYIFNPVLDAGTYEIYAKYVQNTELKYAGNVSSSKGFKVKADLTIELTRTDSGILKPGDSASFTFTVSDVSLMSEVLLYVNKTNINHYGTGSAGITFDAGDIGENDVYMIFEGNGDYNRAESNHIVVKVVKPLETTVTLVLNPDEVLSGESIGIIPTVTDENGKAVTVGVVKVYSTSSYYYADPIAVINVGENGSYIDNTHYAGQSGYLYAVYTGFTTDDTIYSQSPVSAGVKYTILNSNTVTLTVNNVSEVSVTDGISVDVKATLTGGDGVITLYINGKANITLTNGEVTTLTLPVGDYELYANYTRGSDTFVSAISTPVTVNVTEKPEMSVSIELNNASVSKGDEITATVNVTANGVELREGTVEFYNENDVKIGEINLADTTSFAYAASGDAGTHSIWAKYVANGIYSEANSTKASYKIKGILTITLARNGEGLVKPGDRVYFTITYSDSITEGLELWVNETKLGGEDGSSSTYVEFDSSDVGLNNVFIRFTGSDDYEACVSNNVTVEVVKPIETIIIVEVNASEVVAGQNVKVTAKVIEKDSGEIVNVGTISIKDYIYGDVLNTINVGEEYNYTTDANTHPNGYPSYIYATYNGGSTSDKIYASSEQNKTTYYLVYSNALTLIVNEKQEVTIYDGESIDLFADLKGGSDSIVLYINGKENITISKNTKTSMVLPIGEYTIYASYTRANDVYASVVSSEVKVNVLPTKTTEIELISNSPVVYGNDIEITANVTSDGVKITSGQIRYYINGVENETFNVGETLKFKADTIETYNIKATYLGTVEYKQANATAIDVVISKAINNVVIEVIPATYPENITVKVTADVSGEYTLDLNGTVVKVNAGANASVQLKPGNYTVKVIASPDNVNYENNVVSDEFSVLKINNPITQDILTIDTNGSNPSISINLPEAEGVLYVTINNKTYNATLEDGKATVKLPALNPGKYNATVKYSGDDNHDGSEVEVNFTVEPTENPLTKDVLTVNESDKTVFTVNLPQNASGNLTIVVGNKTYNAIIKDGNGSVVVDDLAPGEYNATVIYSGDDYYARGELKTNFTVTKKDISPDDAFDISVPNGSTNPVFSIKLPSDATGNFTVSVDGKNHTVALVNGSASITLDDLTSGIHNVVVTYSGDGNYSEISKNTTVNVPKPVLSQNKNINVIYSAKATYKVLVTANGKAVVGEVVKITFNGKTYNVKTDSKGYATLNLKTTVKVKKYTITAEFKGVKVTNKVNVKHIIKAKNLKVKKSRKVVKIKIKLKKVNGKYLKGKKVKLKLKGKTLKAKTNKKGVATFKVKKNILKILKVGKKYKYTVTFGKDKVVKKINVKR